MEQENAWCVFFKELPLTRVKCFTAPIIWSSTVIYDFKKIVAAWYAIVFTVIKLDSIGSMQMVCRWEAVIDHALPGVY